MKTVVVTGGAGFFGCILKQQLLQQGYRCISIDTQPDPDQHENLISLKMDLRQATQVQNHLQAYPIETIYHCAAHLAHGHTAAKKIWSNNVDGTQAIAEVGKQIAAKNLIYISSNCLWGRSYHRPINETDTPEPVDVYGASKLAGEVLLKNYVKAMAITIIRAPTIISEGRLGLLAILFEFIREHKKVWTVGSGDNRYQFIYANDLVNACLLAAQSAAGYNIYHVGADQVDTLKDTFNYVIQQGNSRSVVKALPKHATIFAMKLSHWLKLSPLGPYHYKMISEDFSFDTTKIKQALNWQPTLSNGEMLAQAYAYYLKNYHDIIQRHNASAHRSASAMGIIRLLKWLS